MLHQCWTCDCKCQPGAPGRAAGLARAPPRAETAAAANAQAAILRTWELLSFSAKASNVCTVHPSSQEIPKT